MARIKTRGSQVGIKRRLQFFCWNWHLFLVGALVSYGCGIEVGNPNEDPADPTTPTSAINLELGQDVMDDVESLQLAFSGVEFVSEDGTSEYIDTNSPNSTVDLLASSETTSLALTDSGDSEDTVTETNGITLISARPLKRAKYTSVILHVNGAVSNTVKIAGQDYPVSIDEAGLTSIEVDYEIDLNDQESYDVVVQPSLEDSIEIKDNRAIFKPRFQLGRKRALARLWGKLPLPILGRGYVCAFPVNRGLTVAPRRIQEIEKAKHIALRERERRPSYKAPKPEFRAKQSADAQNPCRGTPFKGRTFGAKFGFKIPMPAGSYNLRVVNATTRKVWDTTETFAVEAGKANFIENLKFEKVFDGRGGE